LKLDPATRRVTRAGETVNLTPREFSLLELLLRNHGPVVSRETILESVWGFDCDVSGNTLEAFVRLLRLKVDTREPKLIQTVRGIGYSLGSHESGRAMKQRSLRFRLTAWYAAALLAGLGLFSGLVWLSLRARLMGEVEEDLAIAPASLNAMPRLRRGKRRRKSRPDISNRSSPSSVRRCSGKLSHAARAGWICV